MSISSAFKVIDGGYEIQRIIGSFGSVVYIVTAPALVWVEKVQTSLEAFCIAYPAGIAACIGATAGAIALKDRQVAKAKAEDRHAD